MLTLISHDFSRGPDPLILAGVARRRSHVPPGLKPACRRHPATGALCRRRPVAPTPGCRLEPDEPSGLACPARTAWTADAVRRAVLPFAVLDSRTDGCHPPRIEPLGSPRQTRAGKRTMQALDGITVLDFTTLLPGPLAR
jgi:hypothetical protein